MIDRQLGWRRLQNDKHHNKIRRRQRIYKCGSYDCDYCIENLTRQYLRENERVLQEYNNFRKYGVESMDRFEKENIRQDMWNAWYEYLGTRTPESTSWPDEQCVQFFADKAIELLDKQNTTLTHVDNKMVRYGLTFVGDSVKETTELQRLDITKDG